MVAVVRQFSGILLHVRVVNAHSHTRTVLHRHVNMPRQDNRLIHLARLIALRQIWVEIMLAIKPRHPGNRRIQRFTRLDCQIHRFTIQDRQHPWQSKIDRMRCRIWLFITCIIVRWTKQFRLRRQLNVTLDPDRHLIFVIDTHYNAPKSLSACSNPAIARFAVCASSATWSSCAI